MSKPQANRVSNIAWAKEGQALLYIVTDEKKRPFRFVTLTFTIVVHALDPFGSQGINLVSLQDLL